MFTKSDSHGILYVATGNCYISEAIKSALLTRRWFNHPISIVTDQPEYPNLASYFDLIIQHNQPHYTYRDKISGLLQSPFKRTLFLDTDAFLAYKAEHIFSYLESAELSATFAPVRHPPGWSDESVPKSFGELNTGVIYLRSNFKVRRLINEWLSLYDYLFSKCNQAWDQASFRSVFWKFLTKKGLKYLPLTSEFNLRTPKPWIVGRGQHVYVIHGRFPDSELDLFENYLNSDIDKFRSFSEWVLMYPNTTIRPKFDRQNCV